MSIFIFQDKTMITEAELKEMHENKQIERFDNFYFMRIVEKLPHTINEEIMQRNKLRFAFSEWWDVYNGRLSRLEKHHEDVKFEDVVIFISLEDCYSYGL